MCLYCYNSWSKRQQKLSCADGMWTHSLHHQLASQVKFNRISVKWLRGRFTYKVTAPCGMGPILRVSRALRDVKVCVCGRLAWGAGWTGAVGTTAEQMLGINQSHWHGPSHQVTSCSVPISYKLIKTYGRKTEAITADAKVKCIQGLERYVRSEKSIRNYYQISLLFKSGAVRSIFILNNFI